MTSTPAEDPWKTSRRLPTARLGVAVVHEIVEMIVTGKLKEGELLPPEATLCEHFGVSRTVLRESIKRLEEKGLVVVAQGRGTEVTQSGSWSMLDHVVLSALIDNDETLGVLDELTVVRSSLESVMAGEVARRRTNSELARLEHTITAMRDLQWNSDSFRQADVFFHFTVMELSRNRLAENIAKNLYRRALESTRYLGVSHVGAYELTLKEHTGVVEAIAVNDVHLAEEAMRSHIVKGWERRRFPA